MPSYATAATVLLLAGLMLSGAAPPRVHAQDDVKRVVVLDFTGPRHRRTRVYAIRALSKMRRVDLVRLSEAHETAERLGVGLEADADLAAVARELEVDAYVGGEVERARRPRWRARVWVRQGHEGELVGEHTWRSRRPAGLARIQRSLRRHLRDALSVAMRPAPAPPADETPEEVETVPAASDATEAPDEAGEPYADAAPPDVDVDAAEGPGEHEALSLRVMLGPMWRSQKYNDIVSQDPARYFNEFSSPFPWVTGRLLWYPGAHFTGGAGAHIGLLAEAGLEFGLKSAQRSSDAEFATTSLLYSGGLHGRVPLGAHELGLTAAWRRHRFEVESENDNGAKRVDIPDVTYESIKLALDARFAFAERLAADAELGYLLLLDTGELEEEDVALATGTLDYFPNTSGGGLDASVGATYQMIDALAARLEVHYTRYFLSFNAEPDDDRVVGGAKDQFTTVSLGLQLSL